MTLTRAHRIHVQRTKQMLDMEIAKRAPRQVVDPRQIAEVALPIVPPTKPKQLLENRK